MALVVAEDANTQGALLSMKVLVLGLLSMWRFSRAFRMVRVSSSVSVATRRYPLLPLDSKTSSTCRSFAAQATKEADESTVLPKSTDTSYQDFCRLAEEIRRHDELYYGGNGEPELTDDEYDALVAQEARYCQEHPDDLLRYQQESGLGIQATRYGGRVGSITTTIQQKKKKFRSTSSLDVHAESIQCEFHTAIVAMAGTNTKQDFK